MIGKVEKAMRYAHEPDRVTFATFPGELFPELAESSHDGAAILGLCPAARKSDLATVRADCGASACEDDACRPTRLPRGFGREEEHDDGRWPLGAAHGSFGPRHERIQ